VTAPAGSVGALDECAILRRIQNGFCPLQSRIVCLPAKGNTVRRVVLQFLNGNNVILVIQDPSRAVGIIICTGTSYRVSVNGVLQPFTAVSCTQETVEGPNFVDYYPDGTGNGNGNGNWNNHNWNGNNNWNSNNNWNNYG
jgi:hypothetical protein